MNALIRYFAEWAKKGGLGGRKYSKNNVQFIDPIDSEALMYKWLQKTSISFRWLE
jgi:hypothetical protein